MTLVLDLATGLGPARAHVDAASDPHACLVLGHGAGGGVEAPDLVTLAAALPPCGVTVVRVEQPWRLAGKRVAPAPPRLDEAWRDVWTALREHERLGPTVVAGGRSAGARVACRTALSLGARAVVALAFPLHPPGRPDRSRRTELLEAGLPVLVVQGSRDPFGSGEEVLAEVETAGDRQSSVAVVAVPGADHSLRTRGHGGKAAGVVRDRGLPAETVAAIAAFVAQVAAGE